MGGSGDCAVGWAYTVCRANSFHFVYFKEKWWEETHFIVVIISGDLLQLMWLCSVRNMFIIFQLILQYLSKCVWEMQPKLTGSTVHYDMIQLIAFSSQVKRMICHTEIYSSSTHLSWAKQTLEQHTSKTSQNCEAY